MFLGYENSNNFSNVFILFQKAQNYLFMSSNLLGLSAFD